MKSLRSGWGALAIVALLAGACSSRDQTLGETRRPPTPRPDPSGGPAPMPDPLPPPSPSIDPAPMPDPLPSPGPSQAACEDAQKHARVGVCVSVGTCFGRPITLTGYECPAGQTCCEAPVGCTQTDCGGSGGGSGGGSAVGVGGDALAGAGG